MEKFGKKTLWKKTLPCNAFEWILNVKIRLNKNYILCTWNLSNSCYWHTNKLKPNFKTSFHIIDFSSYCTSMESLVKQDFMPKNSCYHCLLSNSKKQHTYFSLVQSCQWLVKLFSLFPSIPYCKCLPFIDDLFLNVLNSYLPDSISVTIKCTHQIIMRFINAEWYQQYKTRHVFSYIYLCQQYQSKLDRGCPNRTNTPRPNFCNLSGSLSFQS